MSKCLLSSACVRYTWWPGVRTTALVPSSTTLPPRPWPLEPRAGWRGGHCPPPGWGSEGSPSGVEAIGSGIIIFHPLADCIWPVSNEWRTNNIWTYRSVLQTKIQISSSTTLLLIRCFSGGWSPETGWVTDVLVYRPEDSRWEKVCRVPQFDINTELLCCNWGIQKVGDLQTARDNHAVRVVDGRGGRIHEGKNWYLENHC